ncbi:MAG: hypothetical protein AM1032_000305 [Mycoplasmataceae bacterium]|nr:MAG: hypothetical protein AM1032_000305 [Mycoplasmataceae bacterium]
MDKQETTTNTNVADVANVTDAEILGSNNPIIKKEATTQETTTVAQAEGDNGSDSNGDSSEKSNSFKVFASNVLDQASNHKISLSVSAALIFIVALLYFTAFDKIKALKNRISKSLFNSKKNKK